MSHPETKNVQWARLTIYDESRLAYSECECVYDGVHTTWNAAKRFLRNIELTGRMPRPYRPVSSGCEPHVFKDGKELLYIMTADHPSKPGKVLYKRAHIKVTLGTTSRA